MFCQKCGTSLADGEIFCHECGTRQETAVNSRPVDTFAPAQNPNPAPAPAYAPMQAPNMAPAAVAVKEKKSHKGVIVAVIAVVAVVAVALVLVFTGVIGGVSEKKLIGEWVAREEDNEELYENAELPFSFELSFKFDDDHTGKVFGMFPIEWEYDGDEQILSIDMMGDVLDVKVSFKGGKLVLSDPDSDGGLFGKGTVIFTKDD